MQHKSLHQQGAEPLLEGTLYYHIGLRCKGVVNTSQVSATAGEPPQRPGQGVQLTRQLFRRSCTLNE